jgi:hypothetical protein
MSESQYDAIVRNRKARGRKVPKVEPTSNKVYGESGSSGQSAYETINADINHTMFTGAYQGDARQKRAPAVKAVKAAAKRLKKKK